MHKEKLDSIDGLPLQVLLAYGPLGLVRATAHQLRYDSMTVDTGMVTLDEQADVELLITHRCNDEFINHRIRARVSASSRGMAVLSFNSYARATQQLLKTLINGGSDDETISDIRRLPRLHIPAWLPPHLPPRGRFA